MDNEPKQGQLCRHIVHEKDLCILDATKFDYWEPLTRSEILKLAELAPNDMREQPEQISETMAYRILNILLIKASHNISIAIEAMRQDGLIKQQAQDPVSLPKITDWPDGMACHAFDKNGEGYFWNTIYIETHVEQWYPSSKAPDDYRYKKSGLTLPLGLDWKTTLTLRPNNKAEAFKKMVENNPELVKSFETSSLFNKDNRVTINIPANSVFTLPPASENKGKSITIINDGAQINKAQIVRLSKNLLDDDDYRSPGEK